MVGLPFFRSKRKVIQQVRPAGFLGRMTRAYRAFFDSTEPTVGNCNAWGGTEDSNADSHANPDARQRSRLNSRKETANNSWLRGMQLTDRNDIIGTGPRVQVIDDRFNEAQRIEIADKFNLWTEDVQLAKKFRTQRTAQRTDGEGIGVLFKVEEDHAKQFRHIYRNPVPLNYRNLECDRLRDPRVDFVTDPMNVDGVMLDQYGFPKGYKLLKQHPGSDASIDIGLQDEAPEISSKWVFHWFREDRAEQHRGIPETESSLVMSEAIRGYTASTVKTARNASAVGGVLQTDMEPTAVAKLNADGSQAQDENGELIYETTDINYGATFEADPDIIQAIPKSWSYVQHEQPRQTNDHQRFIQTSVVEVGRAGGMPQNKSTGSSAGYNYASVRQDNQDWSSLVRIERFDRSLDTVKPIFEIWFNEAILLEDFFEDETKAAIRTAIGPDDHPPAPRIKVHWDGQDHVDPWKAARSQTERLRNGSDGMQDVQAGKGHDWDKVKVCNAQALGLTPDEYLEKVTDFLFPPVADRTNRTDAGITQNRVEELQDRLAELEEKLESMTTEIHV